MNQRELMTNVDFDRIIELLESQSQKDKLLAVWNEKLNRVTVIDQREAPNDLVTIHSQLKLRTKAEDHANFPLSAPLLTLVYPHEADIESGRISILTPLGIALLGCSVGQDVEWAGRDGLKRRAMIEDIRYQPEASGDWHL